ncbi:MAG TPA: hypothetical protein VD996_14060 [Chitinophagaceae bacterium]|nr:hypothetical protein [Chitinophagaceae bacterium]
MKKLIYTIASAVVLCAIICSGCKKEVEQPMKQGTELQSQTLHETACKPVVFLQYEQGFFSSWTTVMQRWYEHDKVRYFKLELRGGRHSHGLYFGELQFIMPWGEVRYEGDQVYVKDVQRNMVVFRATVDASGKALASYYYNQYSANDVFSHDTLYYYYTGNRLDSAIQLSKTRLMMPDIRYSWEKYIFQYDASGNIASINAVNAGTTMNFVYDYSRPVSGIFSNHHVNIPFRLTEYLGLIKLPMHHVVTRIHVQGVTSSNQYPGQRFDNFTIDNRLVTAYHDAGNDYFFQKSYYTGWDCGTALPQDSTSGQPISITSLEQLRRLYAPLPK